VFGLSRKPGQSPSLPRLGGGYQGDSDSEEGCPANAQQWQDKERMERFEGQKTIAVASFRTALRNRGTKSKHQVSEVPMMWVFFSMILNASRPH
jgi:hypothetical protein